MQETTHPLDPVALRQIEVRVGLDGRPKDLHDMLMAFGPLVDEVARLRKRDEVLRAMVEGWPDGNGQLDYAAVRWCKGRVLAALADGGVA